MRLLKLCMVLGLVLAVGQQAEAIGFKHAFNGPVTFKLANWDMGTLYQPGTPGTTTNGIAAVNGLTQGTPVGTAYDAHGTGVFTGAAGQEREDGWGIYKVTQIYNTQNISDVLWDTAFGQANGIEIFGMFYGLIDNAVRNSSDTAGQISIQSSNMTFDMWENSFGKFALAGGEQQGTGGRTGFSAYNGITNVGGTKILEGNTVNGDLQLLAGSTGPQGFNSIFVPNSTLDSGHGTFDARIALTDASLRDYNQFNSNGFAAGPDGFQVDFTLNGSTFANTGSLRVGDWTVTSQDPLQGNAIPEPLSMAGVFMGLVGLGGYLRRRRA